MTAGLSFRVVEFGSADYHRMVVLREDVLRKPLGRVFKPEELANDPKYTHLAAFTPAGDAVATTLLHFLSPVQVRFRQVAVADAWQGQGVGRALMEFSEAESRKLGCTEVVLHAREGAVPFYERIGYITEGGYEEEVGVPHIWMRKPL